MTLVPTDGAQLYVIEEGAVPPVVMVLSLAVAKDDALCCWISRMP